MALKRSDKPNVPVEAKASSFWPMTMKVAPSEYARLVARNISFAIAKNIGPNRHRKSGSALSVARLATLRVRT